MYCTGVKDWSEATLSLMTKTLAVWGGMVYYFMFHQLISAFRMRSTASSGANPYHDPRSQHSIEYSALDKFNEQERTL
ncbi:hypothetical protein PG990_011194 [Apiospora arundinis]